MTAVVTMRTPPVRLRDREGGGLPACVRDVVEFTDGSGPPRPVAYVERELPPGGIPAYLAARAGGTRSFVLWADERRGSRVATVVTESARGGVTTFQVLGAHGEVIGTLVHKKAFRGWGVRTRWTVRQPGLPEAVGYKGRIFWWLVWWLLSPLLPVLLVAALFEGSGDLPRGPRRVMWRASGRLLLEFKAFGDKLRLYAPGLDWRLGAALVALIRSFDGWLGTPWDARKV
ncbi:hypothetical protein [Streptomyces sp. V1I6]|uniref:hypothetical protein n=1 Tax=Streptomyces sp. V1I6 TaxID=3042273 RepID=UPI0027890AE5|nr:hypothetical protein [Streptomyces sp. V1I6]MDQ0846584.1 hypothetical protein [Streptomyces sp. V1I6]